MKFGILAVALIALPTTMKQFEPSSTLVVEGTSTVRGFKCAAKTLDAQIAVEDAAPLAALVKGATVTIPSAQLDCGNGTMNEHMRKALKNGEIQFKLEDYTINGSAATLNGQLTISGATKPIEIPATVTEDGNAVRVKATKTIDMTQWGVKPPSLMMGTMKVRPNVNVSFDVTLKK